MARSRIFLVGMPPLLTDLVKHLVSADARLELAGEVPGGDVAVALAGEPDCIVTTVDGLSTSTSELFGALRASRRVRVVGISATDGWAELYEFRPERRFLGEVGVDELAEALNVTGGDE